MYPLAFAQRPLFRIILALIVCTSLLVIPNTLSLTDGVSAQGSDQNSTRQGRPRAGKPEGSLPNLDQTQNESNLEREPAMPIPSTMRSPKNPLKPWNGRRVG